MIKQFVSIFIGGGLGSMLRYGAQILIHRCIAVYNFPWSTFSVNIIGSFLIGLFYALSTKFSLSTEVRLFLTAGLCGGFTTFSTFSNDNLEMLRQGNVMICAAYILLSVILGIGACFVGAWLPSKL